MFIKHGDGKIVAIIEEETLTPEQKLAANKMKKQIKKESETESSELKTSGSK